MKKLTIQHNINGIQTLTTFLIGVGDKVDDDFSLFTQGDDLFWFFVDIDEKCMKILTFYETY